MTRILRYAAIFLVCAVALGATAYYVAGPSIRVAKAVESKGADKEAAGHEENSVTMSDAKVAAAGIELLEAKPGELRDSLRLNGIIQPNQETVVQVTPRFPGIVREVRKRLGDKVVKGELLAKVESNQSLTVYELAAPIAGTVIERQAALGEFASEQKPLFIVADLSTVWIDFSVYRRDFARVRLGQSVIIDAEDGGPPIQATIAYVSPLGSSDTQSGLARAVVANDGRLRPGLFVTGRVLLSVKPVDIAISAAAIQTLEGKSVVFARNGDRFEAREVELGGRDGERIEVLFGLLPGDIYAGRNSFVVKAEIGKESAAHEH
jgi:cobalt-zinc-cadmium efflux system membrane fusion protein